MRLQVCVSVQIRGTRKPSVGATLVVALLVYHRHRGCATCLWSPCPFTTSIGLVQPGHHKGRPVQQPFLDPKSERLPVCFLSLFLLRCGIISAHPGVDRGEVPVGESGCPPNLPFS